MADPHDRREIFRGILLIVLAASMFGAVDGIGKILAQTQSVGQIVWARYALGFPLLLATTRPAVWSQLFSTRRPLLQIVRGLTPLAVSGGMVLGVRYLPLAEATVVLFAGPFLVVALSPSLLGEQVRTSSWIAVVVGFIAVVIVSRPGFSDLSKYTAFPLLAAVFQAFLQLITRRLGVLGEKAPTTLAWTLLVGGLASTPVASATWAPTTPTAWLLMIALGTVFGASQLLQIRAYTHAPAGLLAPFNYIQIISAVIFGMVVFGDVPDVWTLIGVVMIIGAGVYVVRKRAR